MGHQSRYHLICFLGEIQNPEVKFDVFFPGGCNHMGVFKNRGTPKWMVYSGKPYEQMDDLGVPLFLETPIYYIPPKKR